MMTQHINAILRRFMGEQQTAIEDIYPCLVGQAQRNKERMDKIKAEMGEKWILHPAHTKRKLKKARPV